MKPKHMRLALAVRMPRSRYLIDLTSNLVTKTRDGVRIDLPRPDGAVGDLSHSGCIILRDFLIAHYPMEKPK